MDDVRLSTLFQANLELALEKSEQMLCTAAGCPDFKEFLLNLRKQYPQEKCIASWSTRTLIIHCETCRLSEGSCICIECFLNGNHQGHKYYSRFSTNGNCDCGDSVLLKPSGFCHLHAEATPKQLEQPLKDVVLRVFKAAVSSIEYSVIYNHDNLAAVMNWLLQFISISDVFRRLIAAAFQESLDLTQLFIKCGYLKTQHAHLFIDFFVQLINDDAFREYSSNKIIPEYHILLQAFLQCAASRSDLPGLRKVQRICFHFFSPDVVRTVISEGYDWQAHIARILTVFSTFLNCNPTSAFATRSRLSHEFSQIGTIVEVGLTFEPRPVDLIDSIIGFCTALDASTTIFRALDEKLDDPYKLDLFRNTIAYCFNIAFHKLNCVTSTPFEALIPLLDEPEATSVLDAGAPFKLIFLLSQFSFQCLRGDVDLLQEVASPYFAQWVYYPVRMFAVMYLIGFDFFVRNPDSFRIAVCSIQFSTNVKYRLMPAFALIQTCLGLADCKSEILLQIATSFGFKNDDENIAFAFVHFLACLVYDRTCLNHDIDKMETQHVKFKLLTGPLEIYELERDAISQVAKHWSDYQGFIKRTDGKLHLIDDMTWTAVSPIEQISAVRRVICEKKSINAPPFEDVFDLRQILFLPVFYAFEFSLMSRFSSSAEVLIYLKAFVKTQWELATCHEMRSSQVFVNSLTELPNVLPDEFAHFLVCEVSCEDNPPASFLSLLEAADRKFLVSLGILDPIPEPEEPVDNMQRQESEKRKRAILDNFKARQEQFHMDATDEVEDSDSDQCSVCRCLGTTPIGYPVTYFKSLLPSFAAVEDLHTIVDIHLCVHPLHYKCVAHQYAFTCPVDRTFKNAILPIHPDVESATNFMNQIYRGFPIIPGIMRTIVGKIKLLEIRQRKVPDAITRTSETILMRSFIEMARLILPNDRTSWDDEYMVIVQQVLKGVYPHDVTDNEMFRRRVRILYFYAMNERPEELDLSRDALSTYFGSPTTEASLEPYRLGILPDFLRNYTQNVRTKNFPVALCLFTGLLVDISLFPGMGISINLRQHIDKNLDGSFSVFLDITSQRASSFFLAYSPYTFPIYIPGPYQSEFGVEDPGLEIGEPLFATQERIEKLSDYIISGDWTEKMFILAQRD